MSSIDKINVGGVDFDIASSPTPVMAPVETGTTATQAYAVGDYVIVGSTLHEVTAAIAIDDTFTEGTNISTSTSLGDEIKQLNNDLTANSNKFEASYQNGKYGFTINGTFYEIGGGGMPILDYANPIKLLTGRDGDNSGSYTVPRDCYMTGILAGGGGSQAGAKVFKIDGTDVFSFYHDASETNLVLVPITKLKQGQVLTYSGWDTSQVHNLGLYDAL